VSHSVRRCSRSASVCVAFAAILFFNGAALLGACGLSTGDLVAPFSTPEPTPDCPRSPAVHVVVHGPKDESNTFLTILTIVCGTAWLLAVSGAGPPAFSRSIAVIMEVACVVARSPLKTFLAVLATGHCGVDASSPKPNANDQPLITAAFVPSTPSNLRIAYCLALVGTPTVAMAAQHLAAISLLRQTGTNKDVLSMQSPNSIPMLGDALRTLDTKVVFVSNVEGKCQSSSAKKSRFRFSFSFHILRVYEQTQYDKILYLDGDLAVRTSPDRLVEAWARQGTMELRTPVGCSRVPDQKHYNTGVWGITPSRDYAAGLHPWLAAGKFPCGIGFQTWVTIYGANNTWTKTSLAWNLKADQGVSKCMRKLGLKEAHVVHWSGNRKPIGLRTDDPVEARALAAYQAAHLRWLTFLGAPATASETLAGEVPLLSPETPTGRCTVVVHCYTGLADRIFDVIAGVVAAQLAHGCVVPTVHVADRDASRTYDWDRVLSSPEFLVRKQRDPMPLKGGPTAQALHIDGRHFCGQHGVGWVSDVLQESGRVASDSEQRARFVHVARSVGLTPCFPPADIADRVGVHARRGDKIKLGWTSEKKLAKVYTAAIAWLLAHGERKVYLAADEPSFAAKLAERMRNAHIDVVHDGQASAASDLCALAKSKLVVKAGSASQFSSLAAAISGAPMVSFADRRGRNLDRVWKSAGLLTNITELDPEAETGAPGVSWKNLTNWTTSPT